ncbi:helix-turn-helix domain-containing protein [Pseudactinotalea sp. Z1748]|uniref:helix-turn-helix domain-containing protein n=1 Tax=Pseudactinotalea sp. Z1748 TaxID=3413027 RepID=UPI003C7B3015
MALTPLTPVQQATILALVEARRLDVVPADVARATSFLRQSEERLNQLPLLTRTERAFKTFLIIDLEDQMTKMRNMPAPSPYTSPEQQADLERLGARLRERRKALGVTVVACAEAAGVSRVTVHRIEAGNPSVTIGAYINVAAALGLHLVVPILDAPAAEPATITVGDYPGLRTLAWQTDAGTTITETEALNLYERGWRHLNQEALTDHEKAFIQHLADTYSNGRLLV